jgi:hypothetical protein
MMRSSHKILYYVAVLPARAAEIDFVQRVASVIGKDLYGTRLLLAGKIPKIVARYDTLQTAELTMRTLRGLGLTAIMCEDSELRKPSHNLRAHSLQFGPKEIRFSSKSCQFAKMESGDALLIVAGRVETRESTKVTRTRTKLNVPATLLTGGIPVRRKVTENTTETAVLTERFVRMLDKKSPDFSVEIRQNDFDYSCLFPKVAAAAPENFSDLIARIRETFPHAVFDDTLTGNFGLCLPYITPWENIDILCRLIHLFTMSSISLDS